MKQLMTLNGKSISKENMRDYIGFLKGALDDVQNAHDRILLVGLHHAPAERVAILKLSATLIDKIHSELQEVLQDDKVTFVKMPEEF